MVARPALLRRLDGPARVTVVVAPAGSGKTVLLRSWAAHPDVAGRVAWVGAGRDERDPRQLWPAVISALRETGQGAGLVRALTAAPDLDGWQAIERILADLAPLDEDLWLIVDDVHKLDVDAARQLELLIMRAPPGLRFVLAARHDVRLGLHRLRLAGELEEIREPDLRFSLDEARELFAAAGVELSDAAAAGLHRRTEGWAAGLRMAVLSLTGHPDPERFAAEFSGSERTVAEYLMAEVLDRQPPKVRRLLLRTSILDRVTGELADLLTGDDDGERVLLDLEQAGAFVMPVDAGRSWFRYHEMFAGLLRLELRLAEPGGIAGLHRAASGWFQGNGHPAEAVRHAQAAGDWERAARLLAGYWPGLYALGRESAVHELIGAFPAGAYADHPELTVLLAADELARGSLEGVERYLALAEEQGTRTRRSGNEVLLAVVKVLRAMQRGDPELTVAEALRLKTAATSAGQAMSGKLVALTKVSIGTAMLSASEPGEARMYLELGIEQARESGLPFLEFRGLAALAVTELVDPPLPAPAGAGRGMLARAEQTARDAVALGERHGWTGEPGYGFAARVLGSVLAWQARPDEAEPWLRAAERLSRPETDPSAAVGVCFARGVTELARERHAAALPVFLRAEELGGRLPESAMWAPLARAVQVHVHAGTGEFEAAEKVLAGMSAAERGRGFTRTTTAGLRLAQGDPGAALDELTPILAGQVAVIPRIWGAGVHLLEALARDALGDRAAADLAMGRALDVTEREGVLLWFRYFPAREILERPVHQTAHAALVTEIMGILDGTGTGSRPGAEAGSGEPRLPDPLSPAELRVLRYLPTHLSVPEIAGELHLSRNTVRTHTRHLYEKLGAHHRAGAVERARGLGLLAPGRGRAG